MAKMLSELTAENQLYIALVRLTTERGKKLSSNPNAEVQIPLQGGGEYISIPILFLAVPKNKRKPTR